MPHGILKGRVQGRRVKIARAGQRGVRLGLQKARSLRFSRLARTSVAGLGLVATAGLAAAKKIRKEERRTLDVIEKRRRDTSARSDELLRLIRKRRKSKRK